MIDILRGAWIVRILQIGRMLTYPTVLPTTCEISKIRCAVSFSSKPFLNIFFMFKKSYFLSINAFLKYLPCRVSVKFQSE